MNAVRPRFSLALATLLAVAIVLLPAPASALQLFSHVSR